MLLTLLALQFAAPARAGYNEGIAAQQKGDLPTAIKEFTPLAKAGNSLAQVRLAEIYFNGGKSVERDNAKGMEWLRKAAAGGNVDAIVFLGQTLVNGSLDQAKDPAEGVRLLELAATKGKDQRAMALLAPIYLQGTAVPKNEERAVALYRQLGELGNPAAWRVLAALANEGTGGLGRDPSIVTGFLAKAVALGDAQSHFYLGQFYLQGKGVPKDDKEGVRLIQLAANAGEFNAMMALANLYIGGNGGLPTDNEAAMKWLSVVLNRAPQGDAYYQASLAAQDLRKHLSNAAISRAQEEAGRFQVQPIKPANAPAKKP
jgi:TPR repeat protein